VRRRFLGEVQSFTPHRAAGVHNDRPSNVTRIDDAPNNLDDDVLEASAEPRTRPLAGPRLLDQSKGDLAEPDL